MVAAMKKITLPAASVGVLCAMFVVVMVLAFLPAGSGSGVGTTSPGDASNAAPVVQQSDATPAPEQSTTAGGDPQDEDDSSSQSSSGRVDANTEAVLAQMRQEEQRRQMEDLARRGQEAQDRRQAEIDQYNVQYDAQTP